MRFLYIFLFVFIGFLSQSALGQSYKFTNSIDSYPEELKEFMTFHIDKAKKKATLEYLDQFAIFWNADSINTQVKKKIVAYSNVMTRKRMHPFPEFKTYLDAILAVSRSERGNEMFMPWLESFENMLSSRSKTNFIKYLNWSKDLFQDNVLYKTSTFKWKTDNLNFTISREGKYPCSFLTVLI